jgi:alpha-glucosidase
MHMAHNFEFVDLPWEAALYRTFIDEFHTRTAGLADAWPCWFLEKHDQPRVASRFDDAGLGAARARAVLLMIYALRGTPFVYQGQELGMSDATVPPDRVVDVDGRDPERAPMPWLRPSVAGPGAGFTTGWSGGSVSWAWTRRGTFLGSCFARAGSRRRSGIRWPPRRRSGRFSGRGRGAPR